MPFSINLPLNLGPPPYHSKHVNIRYALLPTLVLQTVGSRGVVSEVLDIQMLTVFDPYKALASLPKPLIATETIELPYVPGPQSVKLTAGLHRQTWVSGNSLFVDIHIINKCHRTLKRLELQLQRSTLWYTHAAAETGSKNASYLRVPKKQEHDVINNAVVKKAKHWNGTPPNTSEIRTCHIQIPQGYVTISTGRFFEVRYFLNVVVTVAMFKNVTVQLPITLIHMNSLDIMPNALAQVAASIEAKRSKTLPNDPNHPLYQPYHQGQAFVAPQKRSLEHTRSAQPGPENASSPGLDELIRELDRSPRKYQHQHQCSEPLAARTEVVARPAHCRHKSDSECYHCHLTDIGHSKKPSTSSQNGPKLPRLQVSTSGLGFTETELSDFTVQESPPKKVMLSEKERKMVHQQRELKQRADWEETQARTSRAASRREARRARSKPRLVPNAPALLEAQIRRAEPHVMERKTRSRQRSKTLESPLRPGLNQNVPRDPSSVRRRANTGPQLQRPREQRQAERSQAANKPIYEQVARTSSKRRGKMPADEFAISHEGQRPRSRPGSRPQSRRQPSQSREVGDRLMR